MSEERKSNRGLGLGTVLFLIFLFLKLAELGPVQYWSWWWITSPIWIPYLIIAVIGIVAILIVIISKAME